MVAIIALLVAVVLFRVLAPFAGPELANFSPLAALALCGAAWLPRRLALALPLAALFVSDLILNARYGASLFAPELWVRYAALLLVCAIGFAIRNRRTPALLLSGSLLGSVLFYVVTNSASWLGNPAYAQTAAGWVQAMTVGIPTIQPAAWVFFRNAAVGDLLFTALFAGCMALTARRGAVRDAVPVAEGAAVR